MKNFTIYCHNTTGLSLNDENKKKMKEKLLIKNRNRDIIVIPESKCTQDLWIGATSGVNKFYFSGYEPYFAENGMRGVLGLVKKGNSIDVKKAIVLSPDVLRLDIEIGSNKLTIVGVYGTSSHDDPDFSINLRGHLA